FSSRRRHTRCLSDWSSDVCSSDLIVSANIARTIQVCRQAVLDARRAVAWLALQGYERIGILGTSLGSCLAMLTSAHEPRIRAQEIGRASCREREEISVVAVRGTGR